VLAHPSAIGLSSSHLGFLSGSSPSAEQGQPVLHPDLRVLGQPD
jgi:hypothetical protein